MDRERKGTVTLDRSEGLDSTVSNPKSTSLWRRTEKSIGFIRKAQRRERGKNRKKMQPGLNETFDIPVLWRHPLRCVVEKGIGL